MVFQCLKQIAFSLEVILNPTLIMCDFEIAKRNAIKQVFPSVALAGCYFHFTKCLWNKISKLGLRASDFKQNL